MPYRYRYVIMYILFDRQTVARASNASRCMVFYSENIRTEKKTTKIVFTLKFMNPSIIFSVHEDRTLCSFFVLLISKHSYKIVYISVIQ